MLSLSLTRPRRCVVSSPVFLTFALILAIATATRYTGMAVAAVVEYPIRQEIRTEVRTENFIIKNVSDPKVAQALGKAAEQYRRELAIFWFGKPLPNWSAPCPIRVRIGNHLGAGGSTSFRFERGHVFDWDMEIQGSEKRVFDSVLPHEITHTLFASYFRQPLPRWLDEGGATMVEVESEKANYRRMLLEFLQEESPRSLPFNTMFSLAEYPNDALPLYAQGFALAEMLIRTKSPQTYIAFATEGMMTGDWPAAVQRHYGYRSLGDLQTAWVHWVVNGFSPPKEPMIAAVVEHTENMITTEEPLVPIRRMVATASHSSTIPSITPSTEPTYIPAVYTTSSLLSTANSPPQDMAESQPTPQPHSSLQPLRTIVLEWSRSHSDGTSFITAH